MEFCKNKKIYKPNICVSNQKCYMKNVYQSVLKIADLQISPDLPV